MVTVVDTSGATLNPYAPPKVARCSRSLCAGHVAGTTLEIAVVVGQSCFYGYVCIDPVCVRENRDGVCFTSYGSGYSFSTEKLEIARCFIRDFDFAAWESMPFAVVCGNSFHQRFADLDEAIRLATSMWSSYSHQVEVIDRQLVRIWPERNSYAFEQAERERDNNLHLGNNR